MDTKSLVDYWHENADCILAALGCINMNPGVAADYYNDVCHAIFCAMVTRFEPDDLVFLGNVIRDRTMSQLCNDLSLDAHILRAGWHLIDRLIRLSEPTLKAVPPR